MALVPQSIPPGREVSRMYEFEWPQSVSNFTLCFLTAMKKVTQHYYLLKALCSCQEQETGCCRYWLAVLSLETSYREPVLQAFDSHQANSRTGSSDLRHCLRGFTDHGLVNLWLLQEILDLLAWCTLTFVYLIYWWSQFSFSLLYFLAGLNSSFPLFPLLVLRDRDLFQWPKILLH